MYEAFQGVTLLATVLFGMGSVVEAKTEYRKGFLTAGALFLAAAVLQNFLGVG